MPTYLSPGVYVEEKASGSAPIAGVGTSVAGFIGTINTNAWSSADSSDESAPSGYAQAGEIKLITNFTEFKKFFGDFLPPSGDSAGQNTLAHAVYGFFRNGGTRCYVVWISEEQQITPSDK